MFSTEVLSFLQAMEDEKNISLVLFVHFIEFSVQIKINAHFLQ